MGRQIPAPTRLIAGDAAVGQPGLDHAVVVLPAVRVQAAAHAADLHHPGAAEPLHDVDIMDAAVHDRRAVGHQPLIPGPVHGVMILYHPHQGQPADSPLPDQAGRGLIGTVVPQDMGHQHLARGALNQTVKGLPLLQGTGNGLFAQDMLARLQAVPENGQMGVDIGGDDDDVRFRQPQKGAVIRPVMVGPVPAGEQARLLLAGVHRRHHPYVVPEIDVLYVLLPDVAAADEHHAVPLVHDSIPLAFIDICSGIPQPKRCPPPGSPPLPVRW